MSRGNKDWIQTFTGKQFFPLNPDPNAIDILDVAHHLSNQCRFTGASVFHYSVAQHSVLVSEMCDPKDALWGLLHDAPEAYLVDIPKPLKGQKAFKEYMVAEERLMNAVCDVFGLDRKMPESVAIADHRLLQTEARDIMRPCEVPWRNDALCYKWFIQSIPIKLAKQHFLDRFNQLYL